MRGTSMHGNREVPRLLAGRWCRGPHREGQGCNPMMYGHGKSDRPIVPEKPPNKVRTLAAEAVEGRGLAKGNTGQQNTPRTQCRNQGVSSALDRVRQVARQDRETHHPWSEMRFDVLTRGRIPVR